MTVDKAFDMWLGAVIGAIITIVILFLVQGVTEQMDCYPTGEYVSGGNGHIGGYVYLCPESSSVELNR